MFSPQIVDSDAFLDMGQGSQLLYFHLAMRADDDGFVGNPKKILRMVGGNDDDLKVLLVKRFILAFENGVVVIKHWRIHNLIRQDRYHETKYLDEKASLRVKENGSYTERQPNGNQLAPEVRLGKVRLGKESNTPAQSAEGERGEGTTSKKRPTYPDDFDAFWVLYPKRAGKAAAFAQWKKLSAEDRAATLKDIPERLAEDDKWQRGFVKDPERYLKHRQWEDEIIKRKVDLYVV